MKVYVGHSKDMDYVNHIYKPIRSDDFLKNYEIILPHELSDISSNTRDLYKNIDLFIFECSSRGTGLGIELGWAYDDKKKIYVLYKKGSKLSSSVRVVTDNIYEYENSVDMLKYIKDIILKNV